MSKRTKKERRERREKFHQRQQAKAVEDAIARAVAAPRPDPMSVPQGVLQASTVAGMNYAAALAAMPANDYGGDAPDAFFSTMIQRDRYAATPIFTFPPTQALPMIPFRMYGEWSEAKPIHDEAWKFLAAIKRHPKDFTPRLVLADWLEESRLDYGYRWAEIIRAMCPGGVATHSTDLLEMPPFAMLKPLAGRGYGTLIGCHHEGGGGVQYRIETTVPEPVSAIIRHGFIAEVSTTLEGWSRIGPEVMRWHPVQKVDTAKDRDTQPMRLNNDYEFGVWQVPDPLKVQTACCWSTRLMRSAPYQHGTILNREYFLPADLFPKETYLRSTFRDLWFFKTPELAFGFLSRQLRKTAARVANRIGANPDEASKP